MTYLQSVDSGDTTSLPRLPRPRAVFFDLDETLTLRRPALERLAARFVQDYAADLQPISPEDLIAVLEPLDAYGYSPRAEFLASLISLLVWKRQPDLASLYTYWQTTFPGCCIPRAGTHETLGWLRARGIRLGLITNGADAGQRAKIEALEIGPYFDAVVVSCAVGTQKPDPGIFQLACARLDVTPGAAWFAGDHPRNDMWGCAQAGMTGIWLPGPFPWPDDIAPPAARITKLAAIVKLVRAAKDDG